jgi:hypothetical protein
MPPATHPANTPYKFLAYYEYEDKDIFFGRDTEIEVLLSDIISVRLILLFAKTGSGKTSLIKAGVMPRLEELGYQPLYVRVEQDPLTSVREELTRQQLLPEELQSATLEAQLRYAVTALKKADAATTEKPGPAAPEQPDDAPKKPIVLFFDQFEEFFIYVAEGARRREFITSVAQLYHDRGSAVHFVFSFREEFFVEMGAFRDQIPSIFHNDSNLRLKWFAPEQARDALVEPALKYDTQVEPQLVAAVVADLAEAHGIEPARLQIVCDTLWREKEKGRKDALLLSDYERLGRAQGILERRLVEDLDGNLDDDQLRLFERMLPELRTRLGARTEYTLRHGQVFNEVLKPLKRGRTFDDLLQSLEAGRETLTELLRILKSELHLIKEVERYDDIYYEWTSDYLADLTDSLHEHVRALIVRRTLDAAIARAELEAKMTRGRVPVTAAAIHTEEALEALYMSAADFETVSARAELLGPLSLRQASFIFFAALQHGRHMALWFDRAETTVGVDMVWNTIRHTLTDESVPIEQAENAVQLLGEIARRRGEDEQALSCLELALQQDSLCVAAVRVLSEMQTPGALSVLELALERRNLGEQIIDRLGEVKTRASVELIARAMQRPELEARAADTLEAISKGRAGQVATLAASLLADWRHSRQERSAERETGARPHTRPEGEELLSSMGGVKEADWNILLQRIRAGRCMPLLGPSLTPGLGPTHAEISREWAEIYNYPLEENVSDLARVAQFMAVRHDFLLPKERLVEILNRSVESDFTSPDSPYDVLAALPLPVYVTTAYDNALAQALERRRKKARVAICPWNSHLKDMPSPFDSRSPYEPTVAEPVVYHLYGHMSVPESLVLTEDDHIDLLANISREPSLLSPRIQKALTGSSILFLGCDLEGWDFRVLFRGILARYMELSVSRTHLAVQLLPSGDYAAPDSREKLLKYREQYFSQMNIRVYWGIIREFMAELRRRWEGLSDDS